MRFLLLAVLLSVMPRLYGQEKERPSLFDSLYRLQQVHLTLSYPFDSLHKSRRDELDAVISITSSSGTVMKEAQMLLDVRGKFRRMTCVIPPLMLNFKKSILRDMELNTHDQIKLVVHCTADEDGLQNLEEEWLCYQLFESISPFAYRTIWTKVTYCDALQQQPDYHAYGILLEPDQDLESRLHLEEKKIYNVAEDSIDFDSYGLVAAFNFLVGNRDWSISASRNAKLFYHAGFRKYIVIPYDFDYANIVGARYRRDVFTEEIVHPFDRVFVGEYFTTFAHTIIQSFLAHETRIMEALYNPINPIDKQRRKKFDQYFTQWFKLMKKEPDENIRFGMVCPYKGGL